MKHRKKYELQLSQEADWYFNTKMKTLRQDNKYTSDEVVLLIQDCEDDFRIERAKGYIPYKCVCGVTWKVRHIGTKEEILKEIKYEMLEYKYENWFTII